MMKRVEQVIGRILDKDGYSEEVREALNEIKTESQRRQRMYEGILSNTPDLAYIFDRNHRIIYANDALLELWGKSLEEVRGKTLMENVTNRNQGIVFDREIDQVIITGKPARGELMSKTENPRYFDYIMVPVVNEEGEVEAVAGTSRDVTDRVEAEELLKKELEDMHRLQNVSTKLSREGSIEYLFDDILNAAIKIMDADRGHLQMVEQGTDQLSIESQHGFSQEFIDYFATISAQAGSCCGEAMQKGQRIIIADIEKSNVFSDETRGIMKKARVYAVQSTPLITRSGRILGMISTHWSETHQPTQRQLSMLDLLARQASDLIEQRQSEAALRESRRQLKATNKTLEKRVAKRTAELEKKARQLRNLTAELTSAEHRERKRLASILHDDLQQLLIAAKMHLGSANDTEGASETAKVNKLLDQAVEVARDLTQQLRPPVLYEAGLVSALEWLATEMRERHHLQIDIDATDEKYALDDDLKVLLFQCVRELLFNIVKYAGVDRAKVRVTDTGDRYLRLEVEDEGKGFDTSSINKENPDKGFGLFSIHERVAAVGGAMDIRSRIGEGTTVQIEIPVCNGNRYRASNDYFPMISSTGSMHAAEPVDSNSISVLVVDDHAIVRRGIANALLGDQHIVLVEEAGDGMEAINMLKNKTVDVILMDMNMPRMNGVEATKKIHRRWPNIPIIGMSVQGDHATEKSMLDAGVEAFLPKSGDFEELISAILRIAQ